MAQFFKDNELADAWTELEVATTRSNKTKTESYDELEHLIDMLDSVDDDTFDEIIKILDNSLEVLNEDMENLLKFGQDVGFIPVGGL